MSYFADLTPHTYSPAVGATTLNIGWLDVAHAFTIGGTSPQFHEALRQLCSRPIHLHRGIHRCQFCPARNGQHGTSADRPRSGNGQIHVEGENGVWYSAPTMVHHYVVEHQYCPPTVFVDAVLRTDAADRSRPDLSQNLLARLLQRFRRKPPNASNHSRLDD